jgi:hypothetical protein
MFATKLRAQARAFARVPVPASSSNELITLSCSITIAIFRSLFIQGWFSTSMLGQARGIRMRVDRKQTPASMQPMPDQDVVMFWAGFGSA